MRYLLLLLLTTVSCARAQTPLELLRLAQDTYKSAEGYQINGRGLRAAFRLFLADQLRCNHCGCSFCSG